MRLLTLSVLLCAVGVIAAPGWPSWPKQPQALTVSVEGFCGPSNGQTCLHSFLGDCCGKIGVCGSGLTFCGDGCQNGFGKCIPTRNGMLVSQDGKCGNGVTCETSGFGECCSGSGWCGKSSEYCENDCQLTFGTCEEGFGTTTPKLIRRADPNPTCPKSNGTIYTTDNGNQYEVQCSIDHAGGDMKMVYVNSNKIADCIAQCESTDGCLTIAMSGTSCYMKSKVGTPVKNSAVRGAVWVGKVSPSSSSASSAAPSTSSASSTDSSSAPSSTDSSATSDRSSSTSSSSSAYPTTTSPTCPAANNTVYIAESGATYLIECFVDRSGGDLKMVWISNNRISGCIEACDETEACIDISMSGTACYMKSKLGNPVPNKGVRGARLIKAAPVSTSTLSLSSSTASVVDTTSSSLIISSFTVSSDASSSTVSSSDSKISSSAVSSSVVLTTDVSTSSVVTSSQTQTNSTSLLSTLSSSSSSTSSSVLTSPSSIILSTGGTGVSGTVSSTSSGKAPYENGKSSTVSAGPTGTGSVTLSTGVSSSSTRSVLVNSTSSAVSSSSVVLTSSVVSTGPTAPIGTGASSGILSSVSSGAPYGNATSNIAVGPTGTGVSSISIPLLTGVSSSSASSVLVNTTTSAASAGPTAPIGTGASSGISSNTASGAPYGNATSNIAVGPTGTGVSSISIPLLTGVSSTFIPVNSTTTFVGTGASSGIPTSTSSGAPYGNVTSNAPIGPTGTGASSNTSISVTTVYNMTSSIQSTVLTVPANATTSFSFNSTASVPLTTAPLTTGPSTVLVSSSSAPYANSTSSTQYPFNNHGGIPKGHAVATNTTACSSKPTSSASCAPCQGQPGSDKFCGYTAYDNSYDVMPITCNTVEYNMDLTECEVSADGIKRAALCVNGQTPGPLLKASWGDTVIVHVTNSMSRNGSSVHWHGIRQNFTNEHDGVVGVTQCALAPGQSMTYTWKATNYGFSWYHSHYTLQAYEGLFGPMYIDGPRTAEADVDAGHLIIQDWSHIPVDAMYHDAEINGVRTLDTGIINGMNINPAATGNNTGERYTVPTKFVPGKKYLFQLLNTGIQSSFKFYIDGHKMTVIAADFVPIIPYETEVLNINIGQRYEIIVEADAEVGDYFLRFDNQNACASTTNSDDIRGIIHYEGSAGLTPNSTAKDYPRKYAGGQILGYCEDEPLTSLVPAHAINVGPQSETIQHNVVVANGNKINLYRWYLDGTTFQTNWADPTLYNIINNDTVPDYSGDLAIEVGLGEWVYVIIESPVPLGHPIHLHGHDFHILASGYGNYDSSVPLNTINPPRRDVAFMPGDGPTGLGGHLVVAFYTDNPGAWLMHCHIGWHVAMGFALQFVEGKELIRDMVQDTCLVNDVCDAWRPWADDKGIITDDSGV